MAKVISKSELLKTINAIEALEIVIEAIDRN